VFISENGYLPKTDAASSNSNHGYNSNQLYITPAPKSAPKMTAEYHQYQQHLQQQQNQREQNQREQQQQQQQHQKQPQQKYRVPNSVPNDETAKDNLKKYVAV
jgi:transcription initiation factor TFIID subunit TAF12